MKRDLAAGLLKVKSVCKRSFSAPKVVAHNSTNLLVVAVDTMRFDHLSNSGMTPNLDLIVKNGTSFESAISACPWTLPSFASAMTGVMPSVHQAGLTGSVRDLGNTAPAGLNPKILTLASHLKKQGYKTCALYSNPFFSFGLDTGFDVCQYHDLPASDMVMLGLDWIRKNSDQPFFCFILLNDTHEPTMPKRRFFTPYLASPATDNQLRNLVRWGNLGKAECSESLKIKKALYAG
ncbi:sulfatase-like hydrolase/transferase, partial [bacterium]|nr:sulfatase-like hydrolase/transferase [bacterium]